MAATHNFLSYLTDLSQKVKGANGQLSDILSTIKCTPQGSDLGLIIFLMYINDLPLNIINSLCALFADGNNLPFSGPPSAIRLHLMKIEEDLNRVFKWMKGNGLKLNTGKTQAIVLGMPNDIAKVGQIKINFAGHKISSYGTLKTIGVTFDPT